MAEKYQPNNFYGDGVEILRNHRHLTLRYGARNSSVCYALSTAHLAHDSITFV